MDIVGITFELENSAALITLSYSNTAQIQLDGFTKNNKMHVICFFSVNRVVLCTSIVIRCRDIVSPARWISMNLGFTDRFVCTFL